MPISFKKILDSGIYSEGDKIGKLDDILFDDRSWVVRYFVVKIKVNFFKNKRILIHTNALSGNDWESGKIHLSITRDQLKNGPGVEVDSPVFRQMEKKYFDFYNWPYYWDDMGNFGMDPRARIETKSNHNETDPNLRSVRIVSNYFLRRNDEKIASIADVIIDEVFWKILYFNLKTNYLSDVTKLSINEIAYIDWYDRSIHLKEKESSTGHDLNY